MNAEDVLCRKVREADYAAEIPLSHLPRNHTIIHHRCHLQLYPASLPSSQIAASLSSRSRTTRSLLSVLASNTRPHTRESRCKIDSSVQSESAHPPVLVLLPCSSTICAGHLGTREGGMRQQIRTWPRGSAITISLCGNHSTSSCRMACYWWYQA